MAENIIYNYGAPKYNIELLVGNRAESKEHDLSQSVKKISWETKRVGGGAKLKFSLLKTEGMGFWEGDMVKLLADGKVLFVGYIFEKTKNDKEEMTAICFDQLRYLKARQSYNFTGLSADGIIRKISADFGLRCGDLDGTGYVIPSLIMDNQTCLDAIYSALIATAKATGRSYYFYDSGGYLRLTAATALVSPCILGDESFTRGYSYVTSINEGVYNYIKLVRPNDMTGSGDAYVAKSPASINKWGMLQHYERVDMDLNEAEIREMTKTLLLKDNRLQRNLTLHCLGIPQIRGGQSVKIQIAKMGDIAADNFLTVENAVHNWDENGYTMDLFFTVFREADTDFAYEMSGFSEYIDVVKKEPKAIRVKKKKPSKGHKDGDSDSKSYNYPFHGNYRVSTVFGKKGRSWSCGWHTGTDYVGINSKDVYAICSGRVSFAGTKSSYGKCVIVDHVDGYVSLYAHLSSLSVKRGQSVSTSTRLGKEGQTGNARGSHLHLELHKSAYKYPPNPRINPHVYIDTHK
ncbi:MAG: M23 family metallopeptidase [Clostridiales bacterium]